MWKEIKSAAKETAASAYRGIEAMPGLAMGAVRAFNAYVNPLTPVVELATGKSVESDLVEDKSRWIAGGQTLMAVLPIMQIEGSLANATERAMMRMETKTAATAEVNVVEQLPDNATVVRGGTNTPELITKGTGTHPSGVTGISVECGTCSVKTLSKDLPNGQIGVTTVGAVRSAGGDVIKTSGRSPNHATLTGIPAEVSSGLLRPTIKNPNKP